MSFRLFSIGLFLFLLVHKAHALTMLTDDFPPYSYEHQGNIHGICMDVVHRVLEESHHTYRVYLFPFARAYVTTRDEKNIFEFCVARTPERENLFHWLGPVGPTLEGMLRLAAREDIHIKDEKDLAAYQIGTVIEDVVDQYLSAREESLGLSIQRTSSYRQNMRKLMAGRIDIWAGNMITGMQLARELGHEAKDLTPVHRFPQLDRDYYLVTGKKSDMDLVRAIGQLFDDFVASGGYGDMAEDFKNQWMEVPELFLETREKKP
ncbi:transporter substrate-binding domain-containing protein [Desulfobotulus sp. H1]|uniref:Transporter substrate-binding domain-containing protein n=1 Tax=Desulfobotulus pelophilus TaxID=2823377 RepID=A0ABT3N811_9BACT|nr:transporter substrate-binding domain-containing protein [Desulfobotulus pelophilus]MCW7753594.1 transporter substrate-binding domain-containing protein [Desulfobotulus pelophilus]